MKNSTKIGRDLIKSLKEVIVYESNFRRPSFQKIYMNMSSMIAQRSHHPDIKVGAVLVSEDFNQVYSVGYNGNESGGSNKLNKKDSGKSEFVHAECNCLIKNKGSRSEKKLLFITLSPCLLCAKLIINSKDIIKVYYKNEYRDKRGIFLLRKRGILVSKL